MYQIQIRSKDLQSHLIFFKSLVNDITGIINNTNVFWIKVGSQFSCCTCRSSDGSHMHLKVSLDSGLLCQLFYLLKSGNCLSKDLGIVAGNIVF